MSLFLCVELKSDGDGDVIIVADALKPFPASFELPCWCSLGWSGTRSQGLIACSIEGGGEGTWWEGGGGDVGEVGFSINVGSGDLPAAG